MQLSIWTMRGISALSLVTIFITALASLINGGGWYGFVPVLLAACLMTVMIFMATRQLHRLQEDHEERQKSLTEVSRLLIWFMKATVKAWNSVHLPMNTDPLVYRDRMILWASGPKQGEMVELTREMIETLVTRQTPQSPRPLTRGSSRRAGPPKSG